MNFFPAQGDYPSAYPTDCPSSEALIHVAIAIIYQEGKFLMQLRDNIPTILYPGIWGLFGGHIEPGETPEAGVKREIREEINYLVEEPLFFGCYPDSKIMRHVFHFPLQVAINELKLLEGWDFGLVTTAELQRGCCYSQQAKEARAIGKIHRQILLDFIDSPWYRHL